MSQFLARKLMTVGSKPVLGELDLRSLAFHDPCRLGRYMRDFEAPMSGSLYLTHNNPDLHALYRVGEEIVTYSSPEECADRVVYCLSHESQAQEIARAGRERARREHTWDHRLARLLALLGAA